MHSANHWGGSLEIANNGDSTAEEYDRSRNLDWDKASINHQQQQQYNNYDQYSHRHNLDETQQSWLLGPPEKKKKKHVDLGCIVCSRKAFKYTIYGIIIAFLVIALPTIIAKTLPKHKTRPSPPDNYTIALHKALLFFNAQKCTFSPSLKFPLFDFMFLFFVNENGIFNEIRFSHMKLSI